MQASHDEGGGGPYRPIAASPEGVLEGPQRIALRRTDWIEPVGYFDSVSQERFSTGLLDWARVDIPEFRLSRMASILLLQGKKLGDILVPNHYVQVEGSEGGAPLFHLLVKVDQWKYWEPPPRLTNMVLASLLEVPEELSPHKALEHIAQQIIAMG
jgi:hypothetical protein